jgi:hypothetical protein
MAEQDRALVRNAADPKQVRNAERAEKRRAEYDAAVMLAVMQSEAGRAFVASEIRRAGVLQSCVARDVTIHHLAAVQNHGLELLARVMKTSPDLYQQMEREVWIREERLAAEVDAAHTQRAAKGADDERRSSGEREG